MKNFEKLKNGFTLIELLIVISLIGVLAAGIVVLLNPKTQIDKANDSKRKSDLEQIQRGLEMYNQDNKAYPATGTGYRITKADGSTIVDWGTDWTPYMGNLPADPSSSKKYVYVKAAGVDGYYLYASLDRGVNDPQICTNLNANEECPTVPAANLCLGKCNYGVSSPNLSP